MAAIGYGAIPAAFAAAVTKADNNTDLSAGGSWVGGAAPAASDLALFDDTITANRSATTSANVSWLGLRVTTQTAAQLFAIPGTANTTLTLGASGIDLTNTSLSLSIAEAIALGASQTWNTSSNTSAGLTVSGVVSGAGFGLTKTGAAALTLSGANTFTGGLTLSQGKLNLQSAGALGTGVFTINAGVTLDNTSAANVTLAGQAAGQVWNGGFAFAGTGGGALSLGTRAVTLTDTVAIGVLNSAAPLTVAGAISGAGFGLVKAGNGGLVLSGNSSAGYTGGVRVDAGVLHVNQGGALGTGTLRLNGGHLDNSANGNVTVSTGNAQVWDADFTFVGTNNLNLGAGPVSLTGNRTLAVAASTLAVGGVISGSGFGLTKTGLGSLVLSGANTFDGGVTLDGGQLTINHGGALGTGTFTIGPGYGTLANTSGSAVTITTNNPQVWAGDFAFAGPDSLDLGTGGVTLQSFPSLAVTAGTLTVGGVISGSGLGIAKLGAGTLVLAGNNQFSGGVNLVAGTLGLARTGALGAGPFTVSGGTLANFSGGDLSLATHNPVSLLADLNYAGPHGLNLGAGDVTMLLPAPTITVAANSTLTIGGTLSGFAAVLTKAGNGTLVLSGDNSALGYDGGTVLSAGTLVFAQANSLPPALAEGSITIQGAGHPTLGFGFAAGQAVLNRVAPGAAAFTFALGANTSASLDFGNHSLGSLGALANRTVNFSGALLPNSSTYRLGGGGGTLQLTANNALSGAGNALAVTGPGVVVLPLSNSYGGGTALNGGVLEFPTLASLGTGAVAFNGGTLRYGAGNSADLSALTLTFGPAGGAIDTNSNNVAFANPIGNGGAGGFTKSGAGNLTLNGGVNYLGSTSVNGGRLILGAGEILPDTGHLAVQNGATFDLGAHSETVAAVSLQNGAIAGLGTLNAGAFAVQQGSISANLGGPGGLTKTGVEGTVVLSGINTYAGATAIEAGTLEFAALANLGANGTVSFNGGTLRWAAGSGADISSRNLVFNGGGATFDTQANDVVLANSIGGNGTGSLTKTGAGNLTLAAPATHTGPTTIAQGVLILGASDALAVSPLILASTGGSLSFGDLTHATVGGLGGNLGLALANNAAQGVALTINTADTTNLTYSGDLSGAGGSLIKAGGGQLTLIGANNYGGGTTIAGGTLVFGATASIAGTGRTVQVASGATVSAGFGIDNSFLNRLAENDGAFTVALAGDSSSNLDFSSSAGANLPNASLGATGNVTYTGVLAPGGGNYRLGGGGGTLTLPNANAVTGGGSLTVTGPGLVVLGAANDYAGGTFLHGGSLRFSSLANLGGGAFSFDGGSLQWGGNNTTDISTRAISFGPNGGGFDTNGNNVTLANAFGGDSPGGLEKRGGGTLTLNGANTYGGGTTLSGGAISFTTLANLGGGPVTLNGGTLNWLGAADISTRLVTARGGNSTLNIASNTSVTFANSIGNGGAGRIVKAGGGALTLNGPSTNTGGFTLAAGTLNLAHPGALGGGALIIQGGTLANPAGNLTTDVLSSAQFAGNFNYEGLSGTTLTLRAASFTAPGPRTITAATAGTTLVIEGDYFASGLTTKTGPGIVTFLDSNVTLAGGLTFPATTGGTLEFVGGNLTVNTSTVTNNGSRLILRNNNATFGLNDALRISANADNGTLRVEAGSRLNVLGNVEVGRSQTGQPNYDNGFIVNGGTANIGADLVVGYRNSGAASTLNSGALTVNGRLVVGIGGTPETGRPSGFRVQNGTLLIKGAEGLVINQGVGTAQVLIAGGHTTTERIAFGPGGVSTNVTSNLSINGGTVLVGSGGISLTGSNITPLINLNGGTLAAKADWASSLNAVIGTAGIRFVTADADNVARNITWNGVLSGGGAVLKSGNGVLSLGGNNTYAGNTTATGGVLAATFLGNGGAASSIGQSGGAATNLVLNGAVLRYTGNNNAATNRQFTLGVNGGGFESSGNGTLAFTSTAAAVLSGADTARTVRLGGTNAGSNTFAPAIVDNGAGATSLLKTGAGKWILAGENTYSGATTVEGGLLQVAAALPNSSVTVNAGGTVAGVGLLGGGVTLNSGGGLFAGDAGVGHTTATTLTVNTGAVVSFGLGVNGSTVGVTQPDGLVLQPLQNGNGGFNLYTAGTTDPWTSLGTFDLFAFSGNLGGAGLAGLDYTTILNPFAGLDYQFSLFNDHTLRLTIVAATSPNAWNVDADGNWSVTSNWGAGTAAGGPNAAGVAVSLPGVITAPRTITLNANRTAGSLDFTSTVSYTLAASGGSTLTLNNSGAPALITVLAGAHTISAPLALTSAGLAVAPANGTRLDLAGAISGPAGALTMAGNGLLVLSGASSYGGGTNFNAGQVEFTSLNNLGGGALSFNGGALRWAPGSVADISTRGITFDSRHGVLDTNGNDVTLANPIGNNGLGGLTKIGDGILTLGGANTYQGPTTIQGGAIGFAALENLGVGATLVFNGGALRWNGDNMADISQRTVVLEAGGAILDLGANNVTFFNPIGGNGAGGLTKRGLGDLNLASGNTYGGNTRVEQGRLIIADGTSLGAVPTTFTPNNLFLADNTTFTISGFSATLPANRGVTVGPESGSGGVTFDVPAFAQLAILGAVANHGSGSAQLIKTGNGELFLGGNSTFSGGVLLNAGTLVTSANGALGGGPLVFNGGQWMLSGSAGAAPGAILLAANATITASGANNVGGNISAAADKVLTLGGSGQITLAGSLGNFLGTVQLTNGALRFNSGDTNLNTGNPNATFDFGVSGSVNSRNPGTIHLGAILSQSVTTTISGPSTGNGTAVFSVGGADVPGTFAGGIVNFNGTTAVAGLAKVGNASLTLTGNNTYTGGTTVSAGTLNIGDGGATGTIGGDAGNVTVAGAGTLNFNRGNTYTVANNINGAGGINHLGSGELVLAGNNAYTGATTISGGGILTVNSLVSGALALDSTTTAPLSLASNTTGPFVRTSGIANGNATVAVGGGNTTALFVGQTVAGAGIPGNTTIVAIDASAGTVTLSANATATAVSANLTYGGSRVVSVSDTAALLVGQIVSGTGIGANARIVAVDAGNDTVTLSSAATANTTANNLSYIYPMITVPTTTGLTVGQTVAGAGVPLNATIASIDAANNTVFLNVGATAGGTGGRNFITRNPLGGSTAEASGLVIANGTFRYSGNAATSTDRLFSIGTNAAVEAAGGAVSFTNPGAIVLLGADTARTFTLSGSNPGANTFAPLLADNGAGPTTLRKAGSGAWTLPNANTYSGGTLLDGGVLRVTNVTGSATGTGPVSIAGGATLTGNGRLDGVVAAHAGSTVIPGDGGVGNLTLGGLAISTGASFHYEFSPDGATNDVIHVANAGGLVTSPLTGGAGGGFALYQAGTTVPFTIFGAYNLFSINGAVGGSGIGAFSDASVLNPQYGVTYGFEAAGGFVRLIISAGNTPNVWNVNAGGNWSTLANWNANTTAVPDGVGALAYFGSIITEDRTVTLDGARTAGNISFDNLHRYTIAPGAGALTLDNGASAATANVVVGSHLVGAPVVLASEGLAAILAANTSLELGGVVSGSGGVTQIGNGVLRLSAANTYAGPTVVSGGTLKVAVLADGGAASGIGSSSAAAGNLVLNGGALAHVGATDSTTDRLATIGPAGGNFQSGGGGAVHFTNTGSLVVAGTDQARTVAFGGDGPGAGTFNLLIPDNGGGATSVTKTGASTWKLAADNTYTGGTVISQGVLEVSALADGGAPSGIGSSAADAANLVLSGGTLRHFSPLGTETNRLFTLGAAGGRLDAAGGGSVNWSNDGALAIGVPNSSPVLTFGVEGEVTFSPAIPNNGTGNVSVVKHGPGVLTLPRANAFAGGATLNGGTLVVRHAGALGSGTVTFTQGTFHPILAANASTIANPFSLAATALEFLTDGSDAVTFGGVFSGNGGFAKNGEGQLTLAAANTFAGGIVINSGTVILGGVTGAGTGTITLNGGTIQTPAVNQTVANDITVQGTGRIIKAGTTNVNILPDAGSLSGGPDSVLLLQIVGGQLTWGGGGNNPFTNFQGTVRVTDNSAGTIRNFSGSGTGPIGSNNLTLDLGNSNITVTPRSNDENDGTTIVLGALAGANAAATLSLAGTSAANFVVGGKNLDTAFAGRIWGANTTLTKAGTGVLTLSGTQNTYTGPTTVNGGTLVVNGAIPTSPTVVNAGGTAAGGESVPGTGVYGAVTVNGGGRISPAQGAIGKLHAASLTLNSDDLTPLLSWTLGDLDNTGDVLHLTGNLVKGAGAVFLFDFQGTGYFAGSPTTYTLVDFAANSGFVAGDFGYANAGPGGAYQGFFTLNANNLQFTITAIPEPGAWAALLAGASLALAALRRRRSRGTL